MKITKKKLQLVINEEIVRLLHERNRDAVFGARPKRNQKPRHWEPPLKKAIRHASGVYSDEEKTLYKDPKHWRAAPQATARKEEDEPWWDEYQKDKKRRGRRAWAAKVLAGKVPGVCNDPGCTPAGKRAFQKAYRMIHGSMKKDTTSIHGGIAEPGKGVTSPSAQEFGKIYVNNMLAAANYVFFGTLIAGATMVTARAGAAMFRSIAGRALTRLEARKMLSFNTTKAISFSEDSTIRQGVMYAHEYAGLKGGRFSKIKFEPVPAAEVPAISYHGRTTPKGVSGINTLERDAGEYAGFYISPRMKTSQEFMGANPAAGDSFLYQVKLKPGARVYRLKTPTMPGEKFHWNAALSDKANEKVLASAFEGEYSSAVHSGISGQFSGLSSSDAVKLQKMGIQALYDAGGEIEIVILDKTIIKSFHRIRSPGYRRPAESAIQRGLAKRARRRARGTPVKKPGFNPDVHTWPPGWDPSKPAPW